MLSRLARQEREALVWRQTVEPLLRKFLETERANGRCADMLDQIRAVLEQPQEAQ